jgi:tRNA threonylcarbamoyladenosine biosynthesis protein TsaB
LLSPAIRLTCPFPSAPCSLGDRSVAQLGSALDWGSRGRGFKSRRSDLSEIVLGIESSSEQGSVALCRNGEVLAELSIDETNRHAENLLPLTERLLADVGLDKRDIGTVVVDIGPGSFTGLRVGIALGTGIGLGLGIPVFGVSSLVVLAHGLLRRLEAHRLEAHRLEAHHDLGQLPLAVCSILDARRGESFLAAFDEHLEPLIEPGIVPNADLAAFIRDRLPGHRPVCAGAPSVTLVPDGWLPPHPLLQTPASLFPTAAEVALLAGSKHVTTDPLPFYLRDADAKLPNLPQNPLTSVD